MTPQTVNAVNLPLQNALNFPAAILQPPYFDANADEAHNYGSMGAVIGHEISHSFDDQGSQFDAEGRMTNWWTKADFDHFSAAGEALAAQFDAYRPLPDLAVNGRQTLSENIADVAGLSDAYDAYRLTLAGKPDAVKDGFSGDQRFFISFAQSWRSKDREAELRDASRQTAMRRSNTGRIRSGTWTLGTMRFRCNHHRSYFCCPTNACACGEARDGPSIQVPAPTRATG
jgi:putative endopeptidase